jgi:hypothetical protein
MAWSVYEVDHPNLKGTLRVLAIPSNIFEVPANLLPPDAPKQPVYALVTQGVIGFNNAGKKGPSNPVALTPNEYISSPKTDVTSSTTPRDEPLNEFVVAGNPPWLVRTKTVLLKAEVITDRYNAYGDPHVGITHNTSHSIAEYKKGELFSP